MRLKDRAFLAAGLLAACVSIPDPAKAQNEAGPPVPAGTDPRFVSRDTVDYDEVGYGTASGAERSGITVAHPSLPVSNFVEVTALDTGRTILVRVADRVPADTGLLIELSSGAAEQLGVAEQGRIPIRVRKVNPPQHERTALTNGQKAAERLETPPALLNALRKKLAGQPLPPQAVKAKAAPVVNGKHAAAPKMQTAAATGRYFIQVAALSNEARAKSLAKSVGGSVQAAGNIWRIRTGPYASEAAARAALGPLRAKGYRDASIAR